jgi:hypothetical protein
MEIYREHTASLGTDATSHVRDTPKREKKKILVPNLQHFVLFHAKKPPLTFSKPLAFIAQAGRSLQPAKPPSFRCFHITDLA